MTLLPALPIILFKVSVCKIISQACCNQDESTLSVSANMAVMAVAHVVRELNSPRKKCTEILESEFYLGINCDDAIVRSPITSMCPTPIPMFS